MLNEKGFHRPTYDEILADRIQKAKELFGEDIQTSEQTPLGKFIRIGAYDMAKAYEDLEMIYYARFPNTANGTSLDRLCTFAGITRNPATRALHKVMVVGDAGTTLGMGELIVCGDNNDITFYNIENAEISSEGTVTVTVECALSGEQGNVKSITSIVNSIIGVSHIEYVGIDTKGEEAETDYELRNRFVIGVEGAGSSNVNSIRAALLRIPTVKSAGIIENATNEIDAKGRPPRSFECYVCGGEDYEQQIGEAIFEKAPIGIKTCSTSSTPVEITVLDNGGYPHVVKFSHTENVNVYIRVTYKKNTSFEEDGEQQIISALVNYINNLGAGNPVIHSVLYSYVYRVNGIEDVTSITLSTNGENYLAQNIDEIEQWQIAKTDATKITLEVVD